MSTNFNSRNPRQSLPNETLSRKRRKYDFKTRVKSSSQTLMGFEEEEEEKKKRKEKKRKKNVFKSRALSLTRRDRKNDIFRNRVRVSAASLRKILPASN